MSSYDLEKVARPPAGAAPDTPSPDPGAASAPDLPFQGATGCGVAGLVLAREADADTPVTGAEQVLRLAQAEGLIRAVEDWLRCAWDPVPARAAAAARAPTYRAVVRDPALAPPGTQLWVPAGALLVPPPAPLRAPGLVWAALEAEVLLAQVPDDALSRLEPGALLWLPPAFGSDWAVTLLDVAGHLPPCPARLDLAAQRLTVAADADGRAASTAPSDASASGEVRQTRRVQVPLDHWMGWARAEAPFQWPVPPPWEARLLHRGTLHASGALLPLGQGCGLRVDALARPAAVGAPA